MKSTYSQALHIDNLIRRYILGRRKKLINSTKIPQHEIETIARCIFPDILAFYESEEGQEEFARWKQQQEKKKDVSKGKSKD